MRTILSAAALVAVTTPPAAASMATLFDTCTSPVTSGEEVGNTLSQLAMRRVTVEGMVPGPDTPVHEALAWTVPVFESMISFREPAENVARTFAADITTTWRVADDFSRGVTFASDRAVVLIGIRQFPDRDAINCIYVGHAETEDDLVLTGLRQPTRSSYFLHRAVVIRAEDEVRPFDYALLGQSYGNRLTAAFGANYPDLSFFRTSVSIPREASQ